MASKKSHYSHHHAPIDTILISVSCLMLGWQTYDRICQHLNHPVNRKLLITIVCQTLGGFFVQHTVPIVDNTKINTPMPVEQLFSNCCTSAGLRSAKSSPSASVARFAQFHDHQYWGLGQQHTRVERFYVFCK